MFQVKFIPLIFPKVLNIYLQVFLLFWKTYFLNTPLLIQTTVKVDLLFEWLIDNTNDFFQHQIN